MRKLGKRMSIVAFDMSVKGQSFILLLDTNNATTLPFVVGNEHALRIVAQTYFNSDHTIDFCVVKVFIFLKIIIILINLTALDNTP